MMSRGQRWLLLTVAVVVMVVVRAAGTRLATPDNNYQMLVDHQMWEAKGQEALRLVAGLELEALVDILSHRAVTPRFRVSPDSRARVSAALSEAGISYKVLISDLASHLREGQRARQAPRAESCTERSCPEPLTENYMTFEQMEFYLNGLAENSSRVNLESIGKSIEGRDIWRVHIKPSSSEAADEDEDRNAVWLEGGIHAREWISSAVTLSLIHNIVADTSLTKNLDVYAVPMANPDGYEYSRNTNRMWRKNRRPNPENLNCSGVDLNRNWDKEFGVGASSNPCSQVYMGTKAFSEPETQALSNEMLRVSSVRKLRLVMALHSYGQILMYPWGWTDEPAPNTRMMKRVGRKFARGAKNPYNTKYTVVNSATGFYYASGATDDWAKAALKTPLVYTLELRDDGTHGFLLPVEMILPTSSEVWKGFKRVLSYINKKM